MRLVLRLRLLLLLHVAVENAAIAVDAEALEQGALGDAHLVDALDGVGERVEEGLIDLGDRKIALDPHAHVEPLDREG